ncbi:MAG: dodecin family protein [Candidatus Latescibacterota bacterium]
MMVKIIEILSTSPDSWEDAAQNAVTESGKTLRNITGVDVIGFKGEVKDGKIVTYKVHVRIAFSVDR